jgi:hypothetical protein
LGNKFVESGIIGMVSSALLAIALDLICSLSIAYELVPFLEHTPNVQHIAFDNLLLLVSAVNQYAKFHLTREFLDQKHALHITLFKDPGLFGVSLYLRTPGTDKFLQRMTHLCLTDMRSESPSGLFSFTGLTHLAVPFDPAQASFRYILNVTDQISSVQCVVFIVDPNVLTTEVIQNAMKLLLETRKENPKVFLLNAEIHTESQLGEGGEVLRDIWETEVRGGETLWERARKYTTTLEFVELETIEVA